MIVHRDRLYQYRGDEPSWLKSAEVIDKDFQGQLKEHEEVSQATEIENEPIQNDTCIYQQIEDHDLLEQEDSFDKEVKTDDINTDRPKRSHRAPDRFGEWV